MVHRKLLLTVLLAVGCSGSKPAPAPQGTASLPPAASAAPALPEGHPPVQPALPPGHPAVGAPDLAPGDPITGTVKLDSRLAGRVGPKDALYVIARKAGSRDIVAVKRVDGVSYPFEFSLSGADAMGPGTPFAGNLDLTVRISKTGDAKPSAGDLEGSLPNVAAGRKGVTLLVDTVRQ